MKNKPGLPPIVLVIFGAAGDLTWRKLTPALYDLYNEKLLPEKISVIGVDGKSISNRNWRERLRVGVARFSRCGNPADWEKFSSCLVGCLTGDFNHSGTYALLTNELKRQKKIMGENAETIFYLATPPAVVEAVIHHLDKTGLTRDPQRSRLVFEKPFGHSQDSAHSLNQSLLNTLNESQIYRMDHFLGKETVQNILAFRFANALFEPVWDRRYIDHIQVTVAEKQGVGHRGGYYDHAGALRDMVQNHLMQIVSLIAMESPVAFTANEIRAHKVDVLRAIRPFPMDNLQPFAARGQYGPGLVEGEQVPGYRNEPDVEPNSDTETFAALKLYIDNWRWQGVPFYVRTGKRMAKDVSRVVIQFRPVPHRSFPSSENIDWQPNLLTIDIQPNEGIRLRFLAKEPGVELRLSPRDMDFRYSEAFQMDSPEAYETLLLDVMQGDATLFMRADQIEFAWQVVDPILNVWGKIEPLDFPNYPSGSWGPESAETLITRDGRSWI